MGLYAKVLKLLFHQCDLKIPMTVAVCQRHSCLCVYSWNTTKNKSYLGSTLNMYTIRPHSAFTHLTHFQEANG